jgi:hypothetical protein
VPRLLPRALLAAFLFATVLVVAGTTPADAAVGPYMRMASAQTYQCSTNDDGTVRVTISQNYEFGGGLRSSDEYRYWFSGPGETAVIAGPYPVIQLTGTLTMGSVSRTAPSYPTGALFAMQTMRAGKVVYYSKVDVWCTGDGTFPTTPEQTKLYTPSARRFAGPTTFECKASGGVASVSTGDGSITYEGLKSGDQWRKHYIIGSNAQVSATYPVEQTSGTAVFGGNYLETKAYPFTWELRLETIIDGQLTHVSSLRGRCDKDATGTVYPIEAEVTPLPFSDWEYAIARPYQDLLGRLPTAAEFGPQYYGVIAGSRTKGDVVESLRRGTENITNVDPTVRLYRAFLGRAPDAGGLKFWIGRRRAGTWSLTRMADSFAASNEFKTKYGSLTNRQFVTRIYTDVLGRAADPSGVNYWTGKLDRREKTRGQVMVGFSESNEYKRKQAENTDVSVAYIFMMGRAPTAAEITDWVTRQKAGTSTVGLTQELLDSDLYAARVAT